MRVNYYFRNPGPFNFSIEKVFKVVSDSFDDSITVRRHYTNTPIDLFAIFRFRKLRADVHHITGAVNYLALAFPPERTVLTVHDIRHYTESFKGIKRTLYGYLFWYYPLRVAHHITAISDFTKNELIKHFMINPDKITVIPNPVDPRYKYQPYIENQLPGKIVILQVGNSNNKNIEGLINSVTDLPIKLLLLRRPNPTLIRHLEANRIEYEFRPDLEEDEVLKAYSECHLVYFASTYEGFGLPILEAMSVGRPVITSRLSPMQEVAGDAALLVNPYSFREIRLAITSIISSFDLYNDLVQRGLLNVKRYHADIIASRYANLYQSIIEKR